MSCDGCGAEQAVLSQLGLPYCPACMEKHALANWATDQLKLLLTRACEDWVATWGHRPYILRSAADEAGILAEQVMEDVLEAHRVSTGQPT